MDSEDSRDSHSDNESAKSGRRSRSVSRSASPLSKPTSPASPGGDASRSRSSSASSSDSERSDSPQSRPRTPKSPTNGSVHSRNSAARSPSPANSSRSTSPEKGGVIEGENCDKRSVKSRSSRSSSRSKSGSPDRASDRSSSKASRASRKSREDGNTSDSSAASVDSSSRKNISKNVDVQAEEISDGDMESDNDKASVASKKKDGQHDLNMSHEDLSDVSDLEDSMGAHSEDEKVAIEDKSAENDQKRHEVDVKRVAEKTNRADDGEEQLDFEAEEGECGEVEDHKQNDEMGNKGGEDREEGETGGDADGEIENEKEKRELEEGEVTDEDDARPEETAPRPICRFFSKGQCTWGASCRFLHPGVTDKGNYTMFEMIRPVVPGDFDRSDRIYGRAEPPPIESAWERGLRTAKEMLRKSMKRKEQDIDFEEKKVNLSLAQEEFDKENGYYGRVPSPEPRYVRHAPVEYPVARPPVEEYYNRRQVIYEPEYVPRERVRPAYRELPTHKMPDYYNNKYEEEAAAKARKPKREVIVQRVEERPARGDEWSDPWMRSKSPAGRKSAGRKRSYSSGSSYSSSSTSRTSSTHSSYRSRSRSPHRRKRSHSRRSRHVSPSVIVSERKAANERAAMMNPPAPRKRAPSPGMLRVAAANPPAPAKEDQFGRTRSKLAVAAALARAKGRRRSSRSSSDSSGSSSSDSDSSGSSSSSSRDGSPMPRRPGVDLSIAKAMDVLKGTEKRQQIKLNLKTPLAARKSELAELARKVDQSQGKKRLASSPPSEDSKAKKANARREELLKQLKAVEDAIAKKRSKVN